MVTASGKGYVMLRIKLAAVLVMPLAFFCAIAAAQKQAQQPNSHTQPVAPMQLKAQAQTLPPSKTPLQGEVYGPHVPDVAPTQKITSVQNAVTDILPTTCATPAYVVPPGDVYGSYVP
jgi:hypothetical protein